MHAIRPYPRTTLAPGAAALDTSWALALLEVRTERRVAVTREDPGLVG